MPYFLIAVLCSCAVLSLGAMVVVGWAIGSNLITSISESWVSMKITTAVGFLATGTLLLTSVLGRIYAVPHAIRDAQATLLMGYSTYLIVQTWFSVPPIGFGQDSNAFTVVPHQPSNMTAIAPRIVTGKLHHV